MMMFYKMLRRKPRLLHSASSSWHFMITTTNLRIDRNTWPAAHLFFSTEARNADGGEEEGILCSLNSSSNPKSEPDLDSKAEATKTLLKRYGFTDTQLSKLYTKLPNIFTSVPERTLLPKLDFYRGTVGFSSTDLPRIICSNPTLLSLSLQNQIVPVYNFIKHLLLSDDSDNDEIVLLKTLTRDGARILGYSLEKRIAPNISALRAAGVPHKQILFLLRKAPTVLVSLSLGESIKRAADMGFEPNTLCFVEAIRMFTGLSKSTWDKKMVAYRRFGLSDQEILKAFRLHPKCMSLSERNIEQTMSFFVHKMGFQPSYLAQNPCLLDYSLEKRIIPRCTFVNYLQARGLLHRKNVSLGCFLTMKEKDFIDKFVSKYEIDAPDLKDIYLGKKFSPLSKSN